MVLKISLILISFLPLVYLPGNYNPYELPKFIVFVLGSLLMAILTVAKTIANKQSLVGKTNVFDKLAKLVFAYWLIVLLTDICGADPRVSILGSYWRHQGFILLSSGVIFFLSLRLSFRKIPNYWLALLPLSAFLISFITILQGIGYYLLGSTAVPTYGGRIVSSLGNPNALGGWLVITAPFLFLEILPRLKPPRLIKGILLTGMIIAIFLSGSRGAVLAAGTTVFVWLICRSVKKPTGLKSHPFLPFLIGMGAVILGGILISNSGHFDHSSPFDNRFIIWQAGWRAVVKEPILGWGQENFEVIFPQRRLTKVDNAHNIFLETAVSTGLLGLLLYGGIIIQAFKEARLGIKLSLVAFLIRASFNPLSIAEIAFFWFLLGWERKQ